MHRLKAKLKNKNIKTKNDEMLNPVENSVDEVHEVGRFEMVTDERDNHVKAVRDFLDPRPP